MTDTIMPRSAINRDRRALCAIHLLLVYGLGMTLPFVLAAAFAGPFLAWVARHRALMGHVEKAMGVMLIVFGILIATNSVNLIADWMIRNFDWSGTLR